MNQGGGWFGIQADFFIIIITIAAEFKVEESQSVSLTCIAT